MLSNRVSEFGMLATSTPSSSNPCLFFRLRQINICSNHTPPHAGTAETTEVNPLREGWEQVNCRERGSEG